MTCFLGYDNITCDIVIDDILTCNVNKVNIYIVHIRVKGKVGAVKLV